MKLPDWFANIPEIALILIAHLAIEILLKKRHSKETGSNEARYYRLLAKDYERLMGKLVKDVTKALESIEKRDKKNIRKLRQMQKMAAHAIAH